jgi:hypothetical protein
MQHQESEVKVYQTTEYSRFKFINGNRELNEQKINRIVADIEAGIDVLKYYPLVVREKDDRLEIDDGQHRFYISKKLKRPVYYIVAPEERKLVDIAKINSNTEKWKTKDFIHCYTQQGNEHYVKLNEFMTVYELSATLAIKLLGDGEPGYGGGGRDGQQKFHRGEFQANHYDEAVKITEACRQFKDFKNWKSASFFLAIYKIMKAGKVTIDELAEKYQGHKDQLTEQPGPKEYIANLEMIYNKRRHERVIIF